MLLSWSFFLEPSESWLHNKKTRARQINQIDHFHYTLMHMIIYKLFHSAAQSVSKVFGIEQTNDPERTSIQRNFRIIADTGTGVILNPLPPPPRYW